MKKRDVKYSKENIIKFFRELRDFISHNKKRIAGTTGVAAITSFITFTSAIAPTMGCNQDDIDAAMNAANNFVNEQTVKPENTTQDVDIPVDVKPTVEPEKTEPVTQDPVEPVEEVNPRDMEAMYGIKDAPMYTDEEVAEAQENIKTKYDEYNNYDDIYDEKLEAIAEDYYKANQNFFGQLYDMTKDITKDSLNKAYADKNSRYFYDEEKGWLFEINRVGLHIYGEDFAYCKQYLADGVADDHNLKPGSVVNGISIMISKDGAFAYVYNQDSLKKQYDMILDEYKWSLNNRKDKGLDKLVEIGYKDIPMEYECVSFINLDEDISLEMK